MLLMLILQIIYCLLISLIQQTHFLVKIHLHFFLHFLEGFYVELTASTSGHALFFSFGRVWLLQQKCGLQTVQVILSKFNDKVKNYC